jgi:hypothetical protein
MMLLAFAGSLVIVLRRFQRCNDGSVDMTGSVELGVPTLDRARKKKSGRKGARGHRHCMHGLLTLHERILLQRGLGADHERV